MAFLFFVLFFLPFFRMPRWDPDTVCHFFGFVVGETLMQYPPSPDPSFSGIGTPSEAHALVPGALKSIKCKKLSSYGA
jgi:hypothetical protein